MVSWARRVLHPRPLVALGGPLLSLLLLAGCPETPGPEDDPCPDDSLVNYENFAAPLFLTWCVPCHSSYLPAEDRQDATETVNFDTYAGVIDQLERIYVRAVEAVGEGGSSMPPAGGTSDEERALLSEWIACGAPP